MQRVPRNLWNDALGTLRPAFAVVALFSFFVNLTMLVAPLYMMQVYDRVLTSQSYDTLLMLTLVAVFLLLLGATVDAMRSRLLVRISSDLDARLSDVLFLRAFDDKRHAAYPGNPEAASQPLRDFDKVRSFMTGAGVLAFFDAPWVPIYLAIIFLFHPLLGSIALGGAIAIFLLTVLGDLTTRKTLSNAGAEIRSSSQLVDEFSRNSDSIRAMGMLPSLAGRWSVHHETGVAWQARASDRMGGLQAFAKALRAGLQIAILGTGAWLALQQSMSAGAMVAASIIMGRALAPVESAIAQWRGYLEARSALGRLKTILAPAHAQANDRATTQLPEPQGHISVENVGLRHADCEAPILQGITFEVKAGELVGLIGPSAAGKSSLARLIAGAGTPTIGKVRLDGADLKDWPKEQLGPFVGYLPQTVELNSGTVAENIARFGRHDSEAIVDAAMMADAHELILTLPNGYDTMIKDGAHHLSGGQRQRIGLAQAVYGRARIIVLDEPNANLDAEGEAALTSTLLRLKAEGRTIIVVAHKASLLADADKLLVLRGGMIDLFGKREAVLSELRQAIAPAPKPAPRVADSSSHAFKGELHEAV